MFILDQDKVENDDDEDGVIQENVGDDIDIKVVDIDLDPLRKIKENSINNVEHLQVLVLDVNITDEDESDSVNEKDNIDHDGVDDVV